MTAKALLAWAFILAFLFILLGCSESKKIAKAIDTLNEHPEAAAKYCGDKFPIDSFVIYTPGATRIDTFYQPVADYVAFDCPPSDTVVTYKVDVKFREKIITKTRTDTFTIVKENTAAVASENFLRAAAEKEAVHWKGKADRRGTLNYYYLIWAIAATALNFRKPIWGAIKAMI